MIYTVTYTDFKGEDTVFGCDTILFDSNMVKLTDNIVEAKPTGNSSEFVPVYDVTELYLPQDRVVIVTMG